MSHSHTRPGQSAAAARWDRENGLHTWPNLDRLEVDAMSENTRAVAYAALADIGAETVASVYIAGQWVDIAEEVPA